ncbi:uncharacterized protein LOC113232142 [Hyposmocoma kahamanoa]|uniref:uncharacterized protein LOC113232142 n=1 Tax=Hyposmocoma kahamanoa TaxID=1477025 RepID=UPI000E6D9AD8|nr:uncharacterized protein LOC113232142 [Hyposmocoma kahamanoa]
MPELIEQMYCSQQIVIPPKFPYILKRYCKAAIKTQPYDLLRWSFEYFKALSLRRPPPVKLRLEYPVYSTEGGLTRGCLKVLCNQLSSLIEVPIHAVKTAWQGFCLDPAELRRILCICQVYQREEYIPFLHFIAVAGGLLTKLSSLIEVPIHAVKTAWQGFCLDPAELRRILCICQVYQREEYIPFLHFIAVAGGLLTKSLTHTMILLCESLTREPDGGSAAIPVMDFLTMYRFLARIDASKDVKYIDGYMEGFEPDVTEELVDEIESVQEPQGQISIDDFWEEDKAGLHKIYLVDDNVPTAPKISDKLQKPIIGAVSRSPSVERAADIERENYLKDRKGKPPIDQEAEVKKVVTDEDKESDGTLRIMVYDEDGQVIPYELYGEPKIKEAVTTSDENAEAEDEENKPLSVSQSQMIEEFVASSYAERNNRRNDLQTTFNEIKTLVEKFRNAQYDLGMVAGRQMSTTSGEFIVQSIEKEIMDYIDKQIGILPDPDLKKKKAKPEEVAMIKELLEDFIDENMDIIAREVEEVEEEEEPIPEIVVVYAVPGIGPPVDEDIIREFEEYAMEICKVQAEVFMPRNIRHFLCPPLEKYVVPIHFSGSGDCGTDTIFSGLNCVFFSNKPTLRALYKSHGYS